jgi:hypothetical protein
MNISVKRAALTALLAGALTFISLGAIIAASGGVVPPATFPNEAGFRQAVFWFELADSGREIELALGDPATDAGRRIRAAMDATHRVDFVFMACYCAFTASLFFLLFRLTASKGSSMPRAALLAGLALCAAALLGDVFETLKLLELSAHPAPGQIGDGILPLQVWTRVKSGALSAAGVVLAVQYGRYFTWRFPGFIIPLLFLLSAVAGLVAISVHQLRFLVEYAGSLGMTGWLAALVHAGMVFFSRGRDA